MTWATCLRTRRTYARVGGERGRRIFRQTVQLARNADLLTTPSEQIAERYRAAGVRHVAVIANALPRQWLKLGRAEHTGIVVGWIAGLTHVTDDRALGISQTLGGLLDRHAELRVHTVGHRLQLRHERYSNVNQVPYPDLPRHLGCLDIGIAPLSDIAFNQARSDIKLKEYAAFGVPWLASPVTPYLPYGRREGGQLVTDDAWQETLERLISSRLERRMLSANAARWARRHSSDSTAAAWEHAFAEAITRRRRN